MNEIEKKYPEIKTDTLNVHSLESFGTHDGPGIRFVVFTQGCQFKCLYCHNPDTITSKDANLMPLSKIIKHIISQKPYFQGQGGGGITISGGEPLLHSKTLIKLFEVMKKEGVHTTLDTNGTLLNDDVKKLLEQTDLVLLDVKHIDSEKHKHLTGVSNKNTLAFAEYLNSIGKPMWLRYVFVPTITDDKADLENWAKTFCSYKNVELVEILPYHKLGIHKWEKLGMEYMLKDVPVPTKEQLEECKNIFEKFFKVKVRIN